MVPQCAQGGRLPLGKAFREFETVEAEQSAFVRQLLEFCNVTKKQMLGYLCFTTETASTNFQLSFSMAEEEFRSK